MEKLMMMWGQGEDDTKGRVSLATTIVYIYRVNISTGATAGFLKHQQVGWRFPCFGTQALLEYLEKMASRFDEGEIQCPSALHWPHKHRTPEKLACEIFKSWLQLQKICTNHWLIFGFLFDILLLAMTMWGNCAHKKKNVNTNFHRQVLHLGIGYKISRISSHLDISCGKRVAS